MEAIAADLSTRYPLDNAGNTALVQPLMDVIVGGVRQRLLILFGAVAFVLFIACTNVANLLLARGSSRSRELAVRSALGAGRSRLVGQLLTESLALGGVGALVGLALARWGIQLLITFAPAGVPRLGQATIDAPRARLCARDCARQQPIFGLARRCARRAPICRAASRMALARLDRAGAGPRSRGARRRRGRAGGAAARRRRAAHSHRHRASIRSSRLRAGWRSSVPASRCPPPTTPSRPASFRPFSASSRKRGSFQASSGSRGDAGAVIGRRQLQRTDRGGTRIRYSQRNQQPLADRHPRLLPDAARAHCRRERIHGCRIDAARRRS